MQENIFHPWIIPGLFNGKKIWNQGLIQLQ